jgi:hypothetical protein
VVVVSMASCPNAEIDEKLFPKVGASKLLGIIKSSIMADKPVIKKYKEEVGCFIKTRSIATISIKENPENIFEVV